MPIQGMQEPETQVPETQVPETQVPETQVPETQINEYLVNNFDDTCIHDDINVRESLDDLDDRLYHDVQRDDDIPHGYDDNVPCGDDVPQHDDDGAYESPHPVNSMHGDSPEEEAGDTGQPQIDLIGVQTDGHMNPEPLPVTCRAPRMSRPHSPEFSSSSTGQEIEKDMMFRNKKEIKRRLSLYAIKNNFEFRVKKSDTGRFDAGCIDTNCTWKLRATPMSGSDYWSIKVYVPEHTCNLNFMHRDHRQASSSVIGELFKSKFTTIGRQFKPKDLIEDVRRELGANMSYEKAWRARECARASVHGTPEESYANLPLWSAVLETNNPGSFTRIETDSENIFQYYFMAFGASIRGFQHMRPVVVVDGTFLKNRYGGILFIAACKDGNEQIYPLAFGIGPKENDASYMWFFSRFKEAYGDRPDLVFITDRHVSFAPTIQSVYPYAEHGYCAYHLRQNMKAKFPRIDKQTWKDIKNYFFQASRAYLTEDFDMYMGQLSQLSSECHQYLIEAHPSKWARSHFKSNRYSIMTSNAAETMNSVLLDAREHPIIPLLNRIVDVLQRWFYERRNSANNHNTSPVTKVLEKILEQRREASQCLRVVAANLYEFDVTGCDLIGHVNIRTKSCSCREFTLDGYPCVHAFAVCKFRSSSVYEFCHSFYTIDVLRAAYSDTIYSHGDPKQWHAPPEVFHRVVLPPLFVTRPGRRKVTRIPSQGEDRNVRKCGRCKRTGHNRKTCTFPVATGSIADH